LTRPLFSYARSVSGLSEVSRASMPMRIRLASRSEPCPTHKMPMTLSCTLERAPESRTVSFFFAWQ
jgi:hypothetical protein